MSIVNHFFPLNVQVLDKNFLRTSCSISENKQKTILKNISYAHITYVESSKVTCTSFFLLNVQFREKNFLGKSCSISEN